MKRFVLPIIGAFLLVGLTIWGSNAGWFGLSLKKEVRPLEAIALVVNLLIAFVLQRFFTTKITDLRAEKNVLIDSAKDILRQLVELREQTEGQFQKEFIDSESATSIKYAFRRSANALTALQGSIGMSHLRSVRDNIHPVWSDFYDLKAVATGDNFPAKGYSIKQLNSQNRLFDSLGAKLRELIFQINDARV